MKRKTRGKEKINMDGRKEGRTSKAKRYAKVEEGIKKRKKILLIPASHTVKPLFLSS